MHDHTRRRLLSLLLAFTILIGLLIPAFAAEPDGRKIPTIQIRGKTAFIYKNVGTPEQEVIFDGWTGRVPVPDGYIAEQVKVLLPKFAKAVLTGNYDDWAADFSHVLEPIYHDMALDRDGNPQFGSGTDWNKDYSGLPDRVNGDGTYSNDVYEFEYDWRLSPLQVVDDLRDYIEAVLAATGKDAYHLVSRCEGTTVAAAYLAKYPDPRIRSVVYITPCSNGCAQISCLFGGDVKLDPDAINRYMSLNFGTDAEDGFGKDLIGDETLMQFVRELISALALTRGLNLPAKKVQEIYDTVKYKVYPGLMMSSFGTWPGYWAMVDDAHYETAKALCGIADNPEYRNFVALLDDYHYNVQNRQVEIIEGMKAQGSSFALIVKYGAEILPFIADADKINDSTLTVEEASFGATTAPIGTTLSDDYVAAAEAEGRGRYLSPDRQIDASTGAFPDETYYLKYCPHGEWYGEFYWLLANVLEKGGAVNADTNDRYPRFMVWDRENMNLAPMTAENAGRYEGYYEKDPGAAVTRLMNSFTKVLRNLIEYVRALISGIVAHAKGTA